MSLPSTSTDVIMMFDGGMLQETELLHETPQEQIQSISLHYSRDGFRCQSVLINYLCISVEDQAFFPATLTPVLIRMS